MDSLDSRNHLHRMSLRGEQEALHHSLTNVSRIGIEGTNVEQRIVREPKNHVADGKAWLNEVIERVDVEAVEPLQEFHVTITQLTSRLNHADGVTEIDQEQRKLISIILELGKVEVSLERLHLAHDLANVVLTIAIHVKGRRHSERAIVWTVLWEYRVVEARRVTEGEGVLVECYKLLQMIREEPAMVDVPLEGQRSHLSFRDLLHVMVLLTKEQQSTNRCTCTNDGENTTEQRSEATPSGMVGRDWSELPPIQTKDDDREHTEDDPEGP